MIIDQRFSRALAVAPGHAQQGFEVFASGSINGMDPPEHTRLRKLVASAFTARRVEALRPRVVSIVNELIDAMLDRPQPVDLVAGFSLPLPAQVICEMLGVSAEDLEQFHAWSDAVMADWQRGTAPDNHSDAGSAGVSTIYPKPSWQQGIPALNGVTGRVFPDISMDASGGTSQASPTFAGILALATQLRGADLGTVNPALAAIGPRGTAAGIIDVPAGYTDSAYGVAGFSTATGYDIASGWGTLYAPAFVPALVAQIDRQHGPGQPSRQAHDELNRLRANISASAYRVARGQAVTITGKGFIPGRSPNGTTIEDGFGVYPPLPGQSGVTSGPYADPASTVPGQTWDHVTATLTGPRPASPQPLVVSGPDGSGTVTVTIDTTGMAAGTYTVTITGRLLTQTISFQVKNPHFG